jgi:hypothetical protein
MEGKLQIYADKGFPSRHSLPLSPLRPLKSTLHPYPRFLPAPLQVHLPPITNHLSPITFHIPLPLRSAPEGTDRFLIPNKILRPIKPSVSG